MATDLFTVNFVEAAGLARIGSHVQFSVPLKRGLLADASRLVVRRAGGDIVPSQISVLLRWPDASMKWIMIDSLVDVVQNSTLVLTGMIEDRPPASSADSLSAVKDSDGWRISGQELSAKFFADEPTIFRMDRSVENAPATSCDVRLEMIAPDGRVHSGVVDELTIEEEGPIKVVICCLGNLSYGEHKLRFSVRVSFIAGQTHVGIESILHNPRAANHRGNLWDLGDRGSCRFNEVAIVVKPTEEITSCRWRVTPANNLIEEANLPWQIYQDSSGGENWRSTNHVDHTGKSTVRFDGYRTYRSSLDQPENEGSRAQPTVVASTMNCSFSATIDKFWQNFPNSIRANADSITLAFFPGEAGGPYELQGGEKKRHVCWLSMSREQSDTRILEEIQPLKLVPDTSAVQATRALPFLSAIPADSQYNKYLQSIIEGDSSFFAKREIIDEYGWRNFGELYADHEAVNSTKNKPLVSHYNNQYDFILAACLNFWRTGDDKWRELMVDLARHVIDIDLYDTEDDRASYNGGLFWHTDHYCDASTATHRTYSCTNYSGKEYGGGPSNEHNYTTGLLNYYFFSGDRAARDAVIRLADWVIAMDDGSSTVYSIVNSRPTGLASRTVSSDYHGPGRGAGNSINALLDAYTLTGARNYMTKAEELLLRCVHPNDEIQNLNLDRPEHRWSYLVFLQVLGKFLDEKAELAEFDYYFYYARSSLLHYADWILSNEKPYKDILDRVDLPTETWPAQDIRKCHVMHLAARHCGDERVTAFADKAAFFSDRCINDLLEFETSDLTRPKVIIAVYAQINYYFQEFGYKDKDHYRYDVMHGYNFGEPSNFIPQQAFLGAGLRDRLRLIVSEVRRVTGDILNRVRLRFLPKQRDVGSGNHGK